MFVIATLMCVLVGTSNQVFNLMKNKDHKDGKIHSLKRFNKADYDQETTIIAKYNDDNEQNGDTIRSNVLMSGEIHHFNTGNKPATIIARRAPTSGYHEFHLETDSI